MSDLLEIFYSDPNMNKEATHVRGNDFCEMLGLFFDLAERIRTYHLNQTSQPARSSSQKLDASGSLALTEISSSFISGNTPTSTTTRRVSGMMTGKTALEKYAPKQIKKKKTKAVGSKKQSQNLDQKLTPAKKTTVSALQEETKQLRLDMDRILQENNAYKTKMKDMELDL